MIQRMININGSLVERDKSGLAITNRGFRFGDSLFESIRIAQGKPLFLEDHYSRLQRGMKDLKMNNAENWDLSSFRAEIMKTLHANEVKNGARLRFTVYRKGEGLYTPRNHEIGYSIDVLTDLPNSFELNSEGLHLGLYDEWPLHPSKYSRYKTNNCLPYIMAGIYASDKGFDDVLILSSSGNICEAVSSNVFMNIEGILYTPPLSDGCVAGVMRKKVLQLCRKFQIPVVESSLSTLMVEKAEEIFLTNSILGLRWVGAFEKKRYFHKLSARLTQQLNELI